MYSTDGSFGKVRLVSTIFSTGALNSLACFSSFGWHECNFRYKIKRTQGLPDYIIFFTVKGFGKLIINENSYNLTKNTIAIVPPYVAHEYFTQPDSLWEFYWINPTGSAAKSLVDFSMSFAKESKSALIFNASVIPYSNIFEIILNGFSKDKNMDELTVSSNVSKLLYRLAADITRSENANDLISEKIIEYFEANYMTQIKLEDLEQLAYFTVPHLIKRFKAETGYTPHEYLNRLRLVKAKELLLFNDLSINEVASLTGFTQTSRFISLYKKHFGITPGAEMRQTNKQNYI